LYLILIYLDSDNLLIMRALLLINIFLSFHLPFSQVHGRTSVFKKANNLRREVTTLLDSAFKNERTHPKLALSFMQQALKLSSKIPEKPDYTRCLIEAGNCCYMQGDDPQAYRYYENAIGQSDKYDDEESQGICYLLIANIFLAEEDQDRALSFAQKAQPIISKGKNKTNIILLNNTLGGAFLKAHRDSALKYCTTAYEMAMATQDAALLAQCALNYGLVHLSYGDRLISLQLLKKSADKSIACHDFHTLILAYEQLANYYNAENRPDSVLIYAHQVFTYSHASGYMLGERFSGRLLESLYQNKSLLDSMLKYCILDMTKFDTISDKKGSKS